MWPTTALITAIALASAAQSPPLGSAPAWSNFADNPPPQARHESGLAAVGGQLYLLGGRGEHAMQVWDPTIRTWREKSAPPVAIHHFQAVELNGELVIAGALTGDFPREIPLDRVLIYNPQTDHWRNGPTLAPERREAPPA